MSRLCRKCGLGVLCPREQMGVKCPNPQCLRSPREEVVEEKSRHGHPMRFHRVWVAEFYAWSLEDS